MFPSTGATSAAFTSRAWRAEGEPIRSDDPQAYEEKNEHCAWRRFFYTHGIQEKPNDNKNNGGMNVIRYEGTSKASNYDVGNDTDR